MNIQVYAKQYMNMLALLMLTAPVILLTAGCDEIDSGEVQNTVQLPMDSVLNFRCEDEGIFPEDCVLDNPENPYVSVAVTEDNKFDLAADAPSAKSRYYLWATALARGAGLQGENQFYTALSLHEVYGESGSLTTRDQARKAYRSVLDNFFLAPTFFIVPNVELLANGGFGSPEATGGDVLCHTGWECENDSFTTAVDGPNSAPVSHNPEDNQSIKQFGNNSLTFQVVPTIQINDFAEIRYTAKVWAMNWIGNGTTDPFTDFGYMELSALDAAGNVLEVEYVYVDAIDDGANVYLPPQDGADVSDWTELSLSVVAPEGAASVKMLLIHQLVGGSGGSLRWDDASIIAEPTIAVAPKDFVGRNLFDPESVGLESLYDDPAQALALSDISNWGYVYDPSTGIMSISRP
jgi:hypothetical protein